MTNRSIKIINIVFLISVIALAATGWFAYTRISPTNQLILHFTQEGQPDYTGSQLDVFGAIAVGGAIVLLNYLLARVLRNREKFFAVGLSFTGLSVSLLLFIAVFVIVVNNQ